MWNIVKCGNVGNLKLPGQQLLHIFLLTPSPGYYLLYILMWSGYIKFSNKRVFVKLDYSPSDKQLSECSQMNILSISYINNTVSHIYCFNHSKKTRYSWQDIHGTNFRLVYYFYPQLSSTRIYSYIDGNNLNLVSSNVECPSFITPIVRHGVKFYKVMILRNKSTIFATQESSLDIAKQISEYYKGFLFSLDTHTDEYVTEKLRLKYQELLIFYKRYKNVRELRSHSLGTYYVFNWQHKRTTFFEYSHPNQLEVARMGDLIRLSVNPCIRDYHLNFPKSSYTASEIYSVSSNLDKYKSKSKYRRYDNSYKPIHRKKSGSYGIFNVSAYRLRKSPLKLKSPSSVKPLYVVNIVLNPSIRKTLYPGISAIYIPCRLRTNKYDNRYTQDIAKHILNRDYLFNFHSFHFPSMTLKDFPSADVKHVSGILKEKFKDCSVDNTSDIQ